LVAAQLAPNNPAAREPRRRGRTSSAGAVPISMSQRRLGYALSNGIRAVISRPRFSDAAFAVGEEDAHVTLRIKYTETTIGISSRSGDRSGRVARPAADPSQATGRVKRLDNQRHRARVLEVRIQSPPAESPQTIGSAPAISRARFQGSPRRASAPARSPSRVQPPPARQGRRGPNGADALTLVRCPMPVISSRGPPYAGT